MGPPAVASGTVTCVLVARADRGPFYIEGEKVRRNITEERPGVPLDAELTVVDASTCKPIKGAAVDIWHCDAGGTYSASSQTALQSHVPARHPADGPEGLRSSRPSTPAGIRAARCTST